MDTAKQFGIPLVRSLGFISLAFAGLTLIDWLRSEPQSFEAWLELWRTVASSLFGVAVLLLTRNQTTVKAPIGSSPAISKSIEALDEPDRRQQTNGVKSLAELAKNNNRHALETLGRVAHLHPNPFVAFYAAMELVKVKETQDTRAVDGFIRGMQSRAFKLNDLSESFYWLGEFKDRRASVPLLEILKDNLSDSKSVECVRAIEKINDPQSLPLLLELFDSSQNGTQNLDVSNSIAHALGTLRDIRAIPKLSSALGESYWGQDKAAAAALTMIGTREAIALVEEWRNGRQNGVKPI